MKAKAFVFIVIAGILWGTSPLFVDFLSAYNFTSVQMTAARCTVSATVMGIYILIYDRSLFKAKLLDLLLYVGIGLGCAGTAIFYFQSMQMTSASTAVVLMYTAPIFVMIFSVAFLGEKFTKLKGISVGCMFVGCALVSGIVGGFSFNTAGVLIGLLSGISYSVYNIITKIAMSRSLNPLTATFYAFLTAAVLSVAICNPVDMAGKIAEKPQITLPMLLLLGAVTHVAPYFLYTLSMRHLSAGTASSLGIIEPMAATVFSIAFLHQIPDVFQIVGIVMILASVLLLAARESNS